MAQHAFGAPRQAIRNAQGLRCRRKRIEIEVAPQAVAARMQVWDRREAA